ncbi:OmpA family protein [Marinomonas sp. 2405UD68-3]|uniref:OmpA family protein n=1 Tax=Marinomonas sp. 2405UD68-3 TaxID=3391835 RepID=UPI0039C9F62A
MSAFRPKKLFIATLAAIASMTTAHNTIADEGFTISPMVGHYNLAGSRDIEDDTLLSIGLGYQFDSPWAAELTLLNVATETSLDTDVDLNQLRLDALYHLEAQGDLTPYLAIGLGMTEFKDSVDDDEALFNIGAGIKYALNSNLALRGDIRVIDSLEGEFIDTATSVGLFYAFGGLKKTVAPVSTPDVVQKAVIDADRDGINDEVDQCLNSHAKDIVDLTGCALDDDKDGVINRLDDCPDSAMGSKVDSKGCYIELVETRSARLDVQFASNSYVVDKQYYSEIEAVATFLRQYPDTDVVIEGYTDDSGKADYNQSLSEKRAAAISTILVEDFNIDNNRVSAVGYGESKPLMDNITEENKKMNRRVVAVVSTQVKTIAK